MAADITAQLARPAASGGDAALPIASGAPSEYQPLAPERVLDTRTTASRLAAGEVRRIDLAAFVPAGTSAVAVNLTSVDPAADGFLTGFACGTDQPTVSSANYTARTNRGALAVLPIADDRGLCVFTSAAADLVVDIQGAFVADGARFTPVVPDRLLDTRNTGRSSVLAVPMPDGVDAVSLNLTVTGSAVGGFLTAFPCGGEIPTVSNVNFGAGETIAGAAYVPVGADGTVCLFTNTPVDVVVDLTGTFSSSGALAFTPAAPTRTLRHARRHRRMGADPRWRTDHRRAGRAARGRRGHRHAHHRHTRPRRVPACLRVRCHSRHVERERHTRWGAGQLGHGRARRRRALVHPGDGGHPRRVRHDRVVVVSRRPAPCRGRLDRRGIDRGGARRRGHATVAVAPHLGRSAAPREQRVYVVTDSVGPGRADGIAHRVRTRLAGDGRRNTRPCSSSNSSRSTSVSEWRPHPSVFGDAAVDRRWVQLLVLGSRPIRSFGRLDHRCAPRGRGDAHLLGDAARREAAVHHGRRLARGAAVLLVLPRGERASRGGARAASRPHARRLGGRRRSARPHLRRDPPEPRRAQRCTAS